MNRIRKLFKSFKISKNPDKLSEEMSESTSAAAKRQKLMEQQEQLAGPTSGSSLASSSSHTLHLSNQQTSPIFNVVHVCIDEIFEYLPLKDLHSLGQTCKLMQKVAGDYFKQHFRYAEKFTHCDGIYTVYSDHKGVRNQRTPTMGFNRFIANISYYYDDLRPLRYLDSHSNEFLSLNDFYIVCASIDSKNVKFLQKILGKVSIVRIHQCHMYYSSDFFKIFLKFCKNVKNLVILDDLGGILRQNGNPWLLREYPTLESVHFAPRSALKINELSEFLERHPKIRSFTTKSMCFWVNREILLKSKAKLDELCIHNKQFFYGDTLMEDISSLCQLLNNLYEREFYKRLHFDSDRFNQEYSDHLSTLRGLEKLSIQKLDGIFGLPMMTSLKELKIHGSHEMTSTDLGMLATNLINLEEVTLGRVDFRNISMFVRRLPNLKKLDVYPSGEILNLWTLNELRRELHNEQLGTSKVTIYVSQEVFMATKWTAKNGDIHLEFVEMRRNTAAW